jgi:hypothetical protein
MAAQKWRKEAEESTCTESDERERKGRRGVVEPGCDPTTIALEKTDNNAIVVEVGGD